MRLWRVFVLSLVLVTARNLAALDLNEMVQDGYKHIAMELAKHGDGLKITVDSAGLQCVLATGAELRFNARSVVNVCEREDHPRAWEVIYQGSVDSLELVNFWWKIQYEDWGFIRIIGESTEFRYWREDLSLLAWLSTQRREIEQAASLVIVNNGLPNFMRGRCILDSSDQTILCNRDRQISELRDANLVIKVDGIQLDPEEEDTLVQVCFRAWSDQLLESSWIEEVVSVKFTGGKWRRAYSSKDYDNVFRSQREGFNAWEPVHPFRSPKDLDFQEHFLEAADSIRSKIHVPMDSATHAKQYVGLGYSFDFGELLMIPHRISRISPSEIRICFNGNLPRFDASFSVELSKSTVHWNRGYGWHDETTLSVIRGARWLIVDSLKWFVNQLPGLEEQVLSEKGSEYISASSTYYDIPHSSWKRLTGFDRKGKKWVYWISQVRAYEASEGQKLWVKLDVSEWTQFWGCSSEELLYAFDGQCWIRQPTN